MGGFGLVTFAVLVLPQLRVGGLQLFMIDLSARPGKFLPKTITVVSQIMIVYVLLTLACALCFSWAGMSGLDAIGHAMAAIATASFSSHDAGLGHFKSAAVEWIATVFMFLSALPFVLFVRLIRGQPRPLLQESQGQRPAGVTGDRGLGGHLRLRLSLDVLAPGDRAGLCRAQLRGEPGCRGDLAGRRWSGLGPPHRSVLHLRPLGDPAIWLLTLGMLAGRLEILLLILPFTRDFWRS